MQRAWLEEQDCLNTWPFLGFREKGWDTAEQQIQVSNKKKTLGPPGRWNYLQMQNAESSFSELLNFTSLYFDGIPGMFHSILVTFCYKCPACIYMKKITVCETKKKFINYSPSLQ